MCLFIILGKRGSLQGEESIRGTQEREGKRDSTAAAEISGSAGQPIELLSWSGGTLEMCVRKCVFVIPCKGSLYFLTDSLLRQDIC